MPIIENQSEPIDIGRPIKAGSKVFLLGEQASESPEAEEGDVEGLRIGIPRSMPYPGLTDDIEQLSMMGRLDFPVRFIEIAIEEASNLLIEGKLDVILAPEDTPIIKAEPLIQTKQVFSDALYVVMKNSDRLAHKPLLHHGDLAGHKVLIPDDEPEFAARATSLVQHLGGTIAPALKKPLSNSMAALKDWVYQTGSTEFAVLPRYVVSRFESRLGYKPVADFSPQAKNIVAAFLSTNKDLPAIQNFASNFRI